MEDPSGTVGLLVRRSDVLAALLDGPREKRDLEEDLGVSRSTVDRAVRDLEVARYVQRTTDGYVLTLSGRLALESYREYADVVGAAGGVADALRPLTPDSDVGVDVVTGATAHRVQGSGRHDPPAPIREVVETADDLRAVLPSVATRTPARWYERVVERGRPLEVVLTPQLFRQLTETVPGLVHSLTEADGFHALAGDPPPYGVLLADHGDATAAYVLTYDDGELHGIVRNDADAAVAWARERYEAERAGATDVTADLRAATAGSTPRFGRRPARAALAAQGFVELTSSFFTEREPSGSCWRTGLGLVEVAAGYAIDREYVPDDGEPAVDAVERDADEDGATGDDAERRNLTDDLVAGLRSGRDHAVVGPPGAGKSTVCKQVACRWHEAGDPVFYRESGAGAAFNDWADLAERVRSRDGDVLVVVEDAVRNEANAVFRLMYEFRDVDDVVFLVDAREDEWRSPESFPFDAALDAYRLESVETVRMPTLDERECERLVERFEAVTGHAVDRSASGLLAEVRGDGGAGGPDELLLLLHRLSRYVDSLSAGTDAPTTLVEDVNRTYAALADAGDRTLDAAVLVNLLNAAGIGARQELVYALATDGDYAAVADAIADLEGDVLFERDDGTYRPVHETWSGLFLDRLLEVEDERAAARRVGRVVTDLLALADDADRRERIDWELAGDAPAIDAIENDPTAWADATVAALFTLPINRPGVAPLFGTTEYSRIALPDACSPDVAARCAEWRGRMYVRAGDLERAEAEFEHLASYGDPSTEASRNKWLGTVERLRSDFDAAESRYEAALEAYRDCEDRPGIADCLNNLGTVALLRGDLDEAEEFLERSLDMHRDLGNVRAEADVLFNLAATLDARGDLDGAIERYEACLESYREAGSRRDVADVLNNLGVALKGRGDLEGAGECYARCLDSYRELGDQIGVANALQNLGVIAQRRGHVELAETRFEDALERYREVGDRQGEAEALGGMGAIASLHDDHDAADRYFGEALSIREDIGDGLGVANDHRYLAEVALDRGDLETAERHGQEAHSRAQDTGGTHGELAAERVLGTVACRRGDLDEAEERFDRALTGCREHDFRYETGSVHVERARLAAARDDLAAAREAYRDAVEAFRETGGVRDAVETLLALAETCAEDGDVDAAREHAVEARDLADAGDIDCSTLDRSPTAVAERFADRAADAADPDEPSAEQD